MATPPGGNGFNVLREDITEIKRDVKELVAQLRGHIESPGHPLMESRVLQLEKEVDTLKNRPLKSWQVVAGIIGLCATFCFLCLSCGGFLLSLLAFLRIHP